MATQTRLPTGDGVNNSYVSSTGSSKYLDVDDPIATPDDASTYLYKEDANANALFTFAAFSVPTGSTIIRLTIHFRAQNAGAGDSNSIGGRLRINSTQYNASLNGLTSSWDDYSSTWTTNPATGAAWTVDDINGIGSNPVQQFGFLAGGISAGERQEVTRTYIEVEYTPAAGGQPTMRRRALTGRPVEIGRQGIQIA